jgi:hypothetical protein
MREKYPAIPNDSVKEAGVRRAWQTGSIIEVFSASGGCWHPALVMQVQKEIDIDLDMLTVQFWLDIEDAKRKSLCRSDGHLQPLGTHCLGQLPIGFQERPSRSRPGQPVFVDATTGLRYETIDLAWAAHFKRWLEHSMPVGTQTIRSVRAVVDAVVPPLPQEAVPDTVAPPLPQEAAPDTVVPPIEQEPVVDAVAPLVQQGTPQQNNLDEHVVEGVVTEFALSLSRDIEDIAAVVPATEMQLTNSTAREEAAPIGLVTEYESDWNTVPQGDDDVGEKLINVEVTLPSEVPSEAKSQHEPKPTVPDSRHADAVQFLSRSAPNATSTMVSHAAEHDAETRRVTFGLVTVP